MAGISTRFASSAQRSHKKTRSSAQKKIYGPLGGKFNEAKLRWRMPNGGRVGFGYLESVKDANE
jgi:hypothetical protein